MEEVENLLARVSYSSPLRNAVSKSRGSEFEEKRKVEKCPSTSALFFTFLKR